MSDSVSKCGRPGQDSRACKPADYADCDDLKSADLTQLISYNGHGLGLVSSGLDRRKFKAPSFKQIRDMDWSKFEGQDGVCRQGNKWFAYKSRQASLPAEAAQVDGEVAAPVAKKDFFAEIFDPIEAGLDLAMKGRFEKAVEEVGPERLAGLGVAALLGLVVVYNIIRWPFRAAKKKRMAIQREEAARARAVEASKEKERLRELDDARRQASDAELRIAQAESAAQEAIRMAHELAAARERTPTPQPLDVIREDTPLPLIRRSDTPPEGTRVEAKKTYAEGREADKTDPNLRPMVSVSVNFDVIDAVMDIKGNPLVEIEKEFGFEIKPSELKKAAILAQAFPVEGKTLVETTTEYLTIGSVFEKESAEVLGEKALIRAVGHVSQEKVGAEAARAALAPYDSWFKTGEVVTDDYKEWWRLKERRMTLTPDEPVRPPAKEPSHTIIVQHEQYAAPASADARRSDIVGRERNERTIDPGVASADVLAEQEAGKIAAARRSTVVLTSGPFDLGEEVVGGSVEDGFLFREERGGLRTQASIHINPVKALESALSKLEKHPKYTGFTETDRRLLAEKVVKAASEIPGFAEEFFDGNSNYIRTGRLEDAVETARGLLPDKPAKMGLSKGLKPRTEERRSGNSGFEELFDEREAKEARGLIEKALEKGGK